jgi:hypothetical protein
MIPSLILTGHANPVEVVSIDPLNLATFAAQRSTKVTDSATSDDENKLK